MISRLIIRIQKNGKIRYYDSKVGRFLSQDPAFWLIGDKIFEERYNKSLQEFLADPQLLNAYSYGRGNPVSYTDETGEQTISVNTLLNPAQWLSRFGGIIASLIFPAFAQAPTNSNPNPTLTTSQQTFANVVTVAGLVLPGTGGSADDVAREVGRAADDVTKALAEELKKLPKQIHHVLTNKGNTFKLQFEKILERYGLKLDEAWNRIEVPQLGRHPDEYHRYILREISRIDKIAQGSKETFLKLFESLKTEVRNTPQMLRKDYWINKPAI